MSNGRALWFRDLQLDEGKAFEELSPSEQVDIACDAYEQQWQQGEQPSIEHFLEDLPLHTRQRAFQEMLPLECEYRIQQGEKISFRDLADRFPEHTLVIARTLCGDDQIIAHTRPAIDRLGDLHLLEVAGRGTFGTAYRAYDERLDRFVAAKLPHPAILNNDDSVRRFVREGRNAGRLSHPGIVSVYDVRKSERGPFIVSDYVEGGTLSDYIKSKKHISPRTAASLVAQLAEALDYAHQHGIVHRDLKPGNVMLEPRKPGDSTQDGTPHDSLRPRILDFGLAHRQDGEASLTMEGTMIGTPAYMSPEQARGEISKTDARVDIYSLGVILYEIMVGQRLFDGESFSAVLTQVLHEDATAPRRFDRGIPRDLATICSKCLDQSPERRYQTAADLAADLRRWLNNQPIHARPISRTERSVRWVNRHRAIVASLCAVIVVAALAGSLILLQGRDSRAHKSIDAMFEAQPSTLAAEMHQVRAETPLSILESRSEDSATTARERLLLRLCMAPRKKLSPEVVLDGINRLEAPELEIVGEELAAVGFADTAPLWQSLQDTDHTVDSASWLKTAGCLACVDSRIEKWPGTADRLAGALTSVSPEQSSAWARMFRPLGSVLSKPLQDLYETTADSNARAAACRALTTLFEQQPYELARLLETAEGPGHRAITEVLRKHEDGPRLLRERLREQLTSPETELPRNALVQTQANLSLGLLALGDTGMVWPLFAGSREDPRLQTYLIRLVPGCVSIEQLVDRLYAEKDADVRYAITLAIGNYSESVLLDLDKGKLVRHLQSVYVTDADSGIHCSTGWLLRRLGQPLDDLNASLTAEGIVANRDWFHNSLGQCMIIVREQEFLMGSPEDEPGHVASEARHVYPIRQPYAIAAREMTWGEFRALMLEFEQGGANDHPVESVRFGEFVEFCRRLNEKESLDNVFVAAESEGTWGVDLTCGGYRVSTDGEWECAARAGTGLMRFFGNFDSPHLDMFMTVSSDSTYPVGSHSPNRWGLFDVYGNVCELTLTRFNRESNPDAYREEASNLDLESHDLLVQRGGRYGHVTKAHRSAYRAPTTLLSKPLRGTGYRLTRSIPLSDGASAIK